MAKRIVKNYPSPRLMETIGATNQKPSEAIGELVANCFDARVNDEKMEIIIDMRGQKIIVLDNGKGMTDSVLERAVCIAEDMSRYIERGEGAKGHFGMGFKTSCSTLGKYYEIFTRPIGEDIEYHVGFDISDYSQRPSGADAWDIEIDEDKPSVSSPLKNAPYGTAFVISRLKDKNIIVSAVMSYLGEAFKGHLETGDKIILIDDTGSHEAIPKKYNFIEGTKIEFDEVFGPNDKYRVTGWMALDTQIHNDVLYGFNIYRHNQLVEKWDKSWFKPHLMTSRIIGEVQMDFLDATFYKQGIQQSEDWAFVTKFMTDFLKPLVKASRNVSKKGNIDKPAVLRDIVKTLNTDYGQEYSGPSIEDGEPAGSGEGFTDPKGKDPKGKDTKGKDTKGKDSGSIVDIIKYVVKEQALVLEDEGEIEITYLEKDSYGSNQSPFDYIFSDSADPDMQHSELQVIMFKNHPLWNKKSDAEVIKILATSDAIYRLLVEKLDFDTSEAFKIRNEWIGRRTSCKEG